jgi:hypothetical protein
MKARNFVKILTLFLMSLILISALSGCEFSTDFSDFDFSIVWDNPVGDVIGDIIVIFLIIIVAILLLPLFLIILAIALVFSVIFAILEFIFAIIMMVVGFLGLIFNWNLI